MAPALQTGAAADASAVTASAFLLPSARVPPQAVVPSPPRPERALGAASTLPLGAVALGTSAAAVCGLRGSRAKPRAAAAVRAFENELGVQAPVGFWDPAGFTQDGDVGDFKRRRETELKHGRISMFAAIGYIVPEYYKFPGYLAPSANLKFADVPNGLAAFGKVPVEGWLQWVALCGFYEMVVNQPQVPDEPGNYGRGQFGFTGQSLSDPDARKRSLNAELANGRLAMVAVTGMLFQNGVVGTTGPEMWLPGAALRAGPKALEGTGGPLPGDFWDPAGLARGKSEEQLLHWRAVELKHGRVCMLACLGWFHVAGGWHPIGDAAARVRVSDDPLVNVAQLPMGGAFQVVFTIMCLEWLTTYVCKPPADKPWDILGWSPVIHTDEPDWKESQLKELNNGRLAMMGIIGLISQDLLSGQYFAEIARPCFGNVVCDDIATWSSPFPPTPYAYPPLYPTP